MVVEKMSLAVINANSPYEVKVALADDSKYLVKAVLCA